MIALGERARGPEPMTEDPIHQLCWSSMAADPTDGLLPCNGYLAQRARAAQWRLDPGFVDLWSIEWTRAALWRSPAPAQLDRLSAPQRARAQSIADPEKKRRYVWVQLWLLQVLARYVGPDAGLLKIEYEAQGRPRLATPGPSFSLSHTQDRALLAVDPQGARVGVDLEFCDPERRLAGIVSRFFSPRDQARFQGLSGSARVERFFWWWTAKEALGKGDGQGLSSELLALELREQGRCGRTGSHARVRWQGQDWELWNLGSYRGCQGALARRQGFGAAPLLRTFWMLPEELA